MKQITVEALTKLCLEQLKKGNGKKVVCLSDDDEGNGYHEMFYGFSENVEELDMYGSLKNPQNKIILG